MRNFNRLRVRFPAEETGIVDRSARANPRSDHLRIEVARPHARKHVPVHDVVTPFSRFHAASARTASERCRAYAAR